MALNIEASPSLWRRWAHSAARMFGRLAAGEEVMVIPRRQYIQATPFVPAEEGDRDDPQFLEALKKLQLSPAARSAFRARQTRIEDWPDEEEAIAPPTADHVSSGLADKSSASASA